MSTHAQQNHDVGESLWREHALSVELHAARAERDEALGRAERAELARDCWRAAHGLALDQRDRARATAQRWEEECWQARGAQ